MSGFANDEPICTSPPSTVANQASEIRGEQETITSIPSLPIDRSGADTVVTAPLSVLSESDDHLEPGGAAQPILAVIVTTAVLYFARDILIPLTVASLLAVVFSPVASRLERFL